MTKCMYVSLFLSILSNLQASLHNLVIQHSCNACKCLSAYLLREKKCNAKSKISGILPAAQNKGDNHLYKMVIM